MKHWIKTSSFATAALALSLAAVAQQPPSQAVRLSYVEGQVRITDASSNVITDQAVANTPLFSGYILQTGDDGRAEVQFDDGTIGRIPPDTALTLTALNGTQNDLTLNNGMAYFDLRANERVLIAGGTTVTSAGGATLRIKLDEAPGEVAVFNGGVHVAGPGTNADLHGGESVKLSGQLNISESIEPDSWDAWNSDREQAISSESATATAATQGLPDSSNPAWGDLNQSGNWYNVPDQGYVWSPYDASDPNWDPYGNGYWMDTPNYGYTWVSGYSWGYLPYQCGLWNWYNGFGWGWAPGACTPWWRGGGGWGINIGIRPGGWRPPVRPNRPRFGGSFAGGRPFRPAPIVPIRRQGPAQNTLLPLRDRHTPVTIGNATVVPLRRSNQDRINRPVYNHQPSQYVPPRFNTSGGGTQPAFGGGRQNYTPAPSYNNNQQRPVFTPPQQSNPGSHARPAPGGPQQFNPGQQQRPQAPQQFRPSAPALRPSAPAPRPSAPAPRPSPPPAPHKN